MNTKIGVMFLSTILSTALLASQNGLTSDILNQANSEKADGAAFAAPISGSDRMLRWTATNETASLVDIRAALVADKLESAETQITNEPSGLGSNASRHGLDQGHDAEQSEGFVQ